MTAKADGVFTMVFGGSLVLAMAAVGVASLFTTTVENTVATYLGDRIKAEGGTFEALTYERADDTVHIEGLAMPGEPGVRAPFAVAALDIAGADPVALDAVMRPAADAAPDPARDGAGPMALFDELTVSGFTSTQEDGTVFSVDSFVIANVTLAPLAAQGTFADADDPDAAKMLEVLSKLSFSRLKAEGSRITVPTGETATSLASLAVSDYARGDVGPASLRALEVSADGDTFTLAGADQAYLKGAATVKSLYEAALAGDEDALALSAVTFGDTSLAGFSYAGSEGHLDIARIAFSDLTYEGLLASNLVFTVEGFRMPVAAFEDADGGMLTALGYETLALDVTMRQVIDVEAGTISIPTYRIAAADMGTIDASLSFSNLSMLKDWSQMSPEDYVAQNPEGVFASLLSASFDGAEVRYTDASLAERLLQSMENSQGISREDVLVQINQSVSESLAALSGHAFMAELEAAIANFLAAPGSIAVRSRPEEPVPVALFSIAGQAPDTLLDVLGLEAEATAP